MNNINTTSYLSYARFLQDRMEFINSGKKSGSDFNLLDTPGHKYFKILFYFGDSAFTSYNQGFKSNGLLHPTWEIFPNSYSSSEIKRYFDYNSAWSFLKLNDENERAEKLEKFVNLLSNINSYSPWYFNSISGLDTALERSGLDDNKLEIGDLKKITIGCIPDAFDNRITTLLELYRDITWSWSQKKQILPANLKKFDMAIYIFESPVKFWHDIDNMTEIDGDKSRYNPSYKMLEFHDCEFCYNSIKSGWGDMNNQTGFNPSYNIEISYGDCYEISYNEHLMRTIGDVISTDTYQAIMNDKTNVSNKSLQSEAQKDNDKQKNFVNYRKDKAPIFDNDKKFPDADDVYSWGNLEMRDNQTYKINYDANGRILHNNKVLESDIPGKPGFLGNVINQGIGLITDHVKEKLTSAVLGNLYTYSLTKIGTQLKEAAQGNLIKAGQSIKQYIENSQQRAESKIRQLPNGNLGTGYDNYNAESAKGEIYDSTPRSFIGIGKSLGNLANKIAPSSIANN